MCSKQRVLIAQKPVGNVEQEHTVTISLESVLVIARIGGMAEFVTFVKEDFTVQTAPGPVANVKQEHSVTTSQGSAHKDVRNIGMETNVTFVKMIILDITVNTHVVSVKVELTVTTSQESVLRVVGIAGVGQNVTCARKDSMELAVKTPVEVVQMELIAITLQGYVQMDVRVIGMEQCVTKEALVELLEGSRRFNMSKDSKEIGVSSVNSDKECKITYRKQSNMSSNSSQASLQVQLPSLDSADDSQYYNTSQISTDIRIDELQNVIASKSEGKENLFLLEYQRLPSKDENKCNAAKKKENVTKNRFKTTFPYDHSRVILEEKWDGHDNDYINASYIKDCDGERRFIAAQGPQKNTLKDFWRVIWQENIGCIIMLTNLVENGKNKCTKYWPGRNQPMTSGPCKVSLLEETTYAFYTIRQFSIQRKKSEEVRTINQFHYTAWPDHGTPGEIELNQFHRTVKKKYQPGLPLLVHCSAGVGRTGTYIGLNVLLQQGRETGRINVFEFVKQMREDRMTMVQTVEQYVFLHKALLCGFQEKDVILSERDFQTKVLTLLNDTSPFNQQTLANEFQFVSVFKTVDDNGSKEDAKKLENMAKNVDMDILPVTKYRPYLTTYVKGRNDYINAVIAPTFTNQNGFIMTQKPLLDTEVDLWRLCMDHGVTALIVLNDTDEGNSWLPNRGETRHCQPFTITAKDTGSDINGVLQDRLLISNSGQKAHVDIYQTSSGNDEALVKCAKMLLEKENASTSTSLVVSKNGAGPAGIFCVLHNAIQQLRIDGEVDIFTRVRQMQTRRPEVITTLEEYRKCYHLVSRSVSSEEIYKTSVFSQIIQAKQHRVNLIAVNRHTGFSVFVFNESSFIPPSSSGETVYTNDPSICPMDEMIIKVNKLTQGIALYNSKDPPLDTNCTGYEPTFATIEICEVLVMACVIGHYGIICEEMCGRCFTGTYCDQFTGECPKGCLENWQGVKCNVPPSTAKVDADKDTLNKFATQAYSKILKRAENNTEVPEEVFSFEVNETEEQNVKQSRSKTQRLRESEEQDDTMSPKKKKKEEISGNAITPASPSPQITSVLPPPESTPINTPPPLRRSAHKRKKNEGI
ncbi:receptor-type tyrosine-protein phosphatase alpha-like [Saccostrea echinata]|uniref:receptor-type tyrosine-protein phosphatase alpha-like n=1 Tax=Saccostrea echinata TaxID=191078 RepID=UPI002A803AF7|nr:receptor-type tyrosine-protein phosphatase alpha-like [Saccostrea echinata]